MDTRLLISREQKKRKQIKNWHRFSILIWVENRMDEWHTDYLNFSFLLSQHWTENQTGYGIIQWKSNGRMTHGPCFRCLVHVTLYCQLKNKQQTLNVRKIWFFNDCEKIENWIGRTVHAPKSSEQTLEIKKTRTKFGNQKTIREIKRTNNLYMFVFKFSYFKIFLYCKCILICQLYEMCKLCVQC